jgi:hypothetical protein
MRWHVRIVKKEIFFQQMVQSQLAVHVEKNKFNFFSPIEFERCKDKNSV